MLCQISISNFALIDQLDMTLQDGFTTLTGETGAGKSIILGALSLVLGNRVQTSPLRDAAKKCVIESRFDTKISAVFDFLRKEDFDEDNPIIVRREISPSGKSRAFINDTPANLHQLKELGALLIDIHSQHENLSLGDASFRLFVLDAYAGLLQERETCKSAFIMAQGLKKKLDELIEKQNRLLLDQDYYTYLKEELESLQPKAGELSGLESELSQLQHAEDIKSNLQGVEEAFDESGGQIISHLQQVLQLLHGLKDISSDLLDLYERVNSTSIELEDIRAEVESLQGRAEHNPQRMGELSERVDAIHAMLHKHQLTEDSELVEKLEELQLKTDSTEQLTKEIEQAQKDWENAEQVWKEHAENLRSVRQTERTKLARQVEGLLHELGMPRAHLEIDLLPLEQGGVYGNDQVAIFFTANAGKDPEEVQKVASGGELSRIMLAVKYILSSKTALPSIIFDEIDTGVSGEIANRMGGMMQEMARSRQVISITHLPQIAAKGKQHFNVYKEHGDERTETRIRILNQEERILELAKMLSGEEVSAIAKENARILLKN